VAIARAVVVATLPGSETVVAGLPLAARAALVLDAAGVEAVAVLAPDRPAWLRGPLERRGVAVTWLATPDDAARFADRAGERGPALVLRGDVLVDAAGARALTAAVPATRFEDASGRAVAWHCLPAELVPCLRAAAAGVAPPAGATARAAEARAPGPESRGHEAPSLEAGEGLVLSLAGAGSPGALEARLLGALARRTERRDSYLAALIDRRLSRPVTRLFLRTPLTPSGVTLLSVAAGLVGAAGLATTSYATRVAGVLCLLASIVLDCVDGEVARARLEQSPAGARLDVVGDYVVHLAVFGGLATGLLRQGLPPGGGRAALALVGGVGAAMLVMHVLFVRPALRQGDLHWGGGGSSGGDTAIADVAEKLASRDYTYLLLVLALLGHLEWFLYAAAVGSWVFAVALLGYRLVAPAARDAAASP
jgi:phosphatidylglycerophosphate synthase